MKHTVCSVICLVVCLVMLAGCSLADIQEQIRITEKLGSIKGKVKLSDGQKGPIVVKRYTLEDDTYVYESFEIPSADGSYQFYVLPGTYYVSAFVDSNRDAEYQSAEAGNYHGSEFGGPAEIKVEAGQAVILETLTISGKPPVFSENTQSRVNLSPSKRNIGRIVSLDDAIFGDANYSMGVWKPIQFLTQIGGGLYFLQEYQKSKIPVLFVHGINGGPTDWEEAIQSLDSRCFQPWVLYYPSGLRLDIISDYLVTAITGLHKEYDFKQLYVIGHSMGGLITRSFVKKYLDRFPENAEIIRLVMTVNSPMNGMKSAISGVKNSPIVVPSWRDVAIDSAFLQDLYKWEWPDEVSYHLVFSYKTGSSDDGVVQLQSQIPLKLQSEAVRMHGLNNTHAGTLYDTDFLELFNAALVDTLR